MVAGNETDRNEPHLRRRAGRWSGFAVTAGLGALVVWGLFDTGIDPMVVIRWKDIFERLEEAIDATEHVANILQGVVIKNS